MRLLAVVVMLAACESEDERFTTCPTESGPAYACGVDWGLPDGAKCEVSCAVPPRYTGSACHACRGYGGELECERTFEWNGQRGCCVVGEHAVRFFGCE